MPADLHRSDPILPCLVCGKTLTSALPDPDVNQPNGATAFTTSGHYGSTAFDPMDGSRLEINVCDECLTARRDRVLHIAQDGSLQPWDVPEGEPVEIVFVGALANPTIEVVYEKDGDGWRASSPQIARLVDHDPSFEALDSRVRARMAEWARADVKVVYTIRGA